MAEALGAMIFAEAMGAAEGVGMSFGALDMAYTASMIAGEALVGGSISLGLMAVNLMLSPTGQPSTPFLDSSGAADGTNLTDQLKNQRSSQAVIPLIYGRTRVGINQVYVGTSGTDNKFLHIIGVVGEGTVKGIAQTDGVDQLFLDDALYTTLGSLAYYEFFTGAPGQALCSTLQAAIPEWNDPMRNTAYIYLRLEYDRDKFSKLPTITLEIEGLKVYDPRDLSIDYSVNGALAGFDFLTRSGRRGGMGIGTTRIGATSVSDSATYCDTKGWTCNLAIVDSMSAIDLFKKIISTFRGELLYSAIEFSIKYRDLYYESVIDTIDENDIINDGSISTLKISQPSVFSTPNAIRIKYLDKDQKCLAADYVLADPDLIVADGGDYREETIALEGINNVTNAMKMANYFLEKRRVNKSVEFVGGLRLLKYEPLDLIYFDHTMPGWEAKVLRVLSAQLTQEETVAIVAEEEDDIFYDDVYNLSAHSFHDTNLPLPSDPVQPVTNITSTEEVYNYRDRSFTRWIIDFDIPAPEVYPWWDYAEIWVDIDGGGYQFMTKAVAGYQLDPVNEGVTYSCKIRSVSIFGARESLNTCPTVSKTIVGKTDNPPDLTSMTGIASGDTVTLWAPESTDPDITGYEVRIGDSWTGGLLWGFFKAPYVRIPGMKPGTYLFWMSPKGNNGLYSQTPVSVQVVVYYPANYADKNTWAWDFTTGTHANTEHETYAAEDAMKCSHTGSVLSGEWTSPVYDLGSIKTVRIWGDFRTSVQNTGQTWEAVAPAPVTWRTLGAETKKWYELFPIISAGQLNAKLIYGDTEEAMDSTIEKFEILAPEISGRYVQVKAQIVDPVLDANLHLLELNMRAAYWS